MHLAADVIVAGAGPAGSTAAALLARHGIRVLLLDRHDFPRQKACGDVVPLGCFLELQKLGLHTAGSDGFPIQNIMLEGPDGTRRTYPLTQHESEDGLTATCVVARATFDEALFRHALACGANFRVANIKGPLVENGRVVGVTETSHGVEVNTYGHIVIGADGATSAIARGLDRRRRTAKDWAVALRGYVDTEVDLDGTIELAFLDEVQPGYAWFFPISRRRANVGVGMRTDYYQRQAQSLPALLSGYLSRPEITNRIGQNSVQSLQAWPIPFFTFDRKRVFDGALLAGDAGGFVHPITAAGIFPAIISGKCAAEAVIQALATGDLSQSGLAHYTTLWQAALADDFKPAVAANQLATLFPHLASAALLFSKATAGNSPAGGSSPPHSLGKFA